MAEVINIQLDKKRALLNRVREWAKSKGVDPEKVSYSFLRVAVLMVSGQSTYKFDLKNGPSVEVVHNKLLDQNDSFIPLGIGIRLLGEDPATPGVGLLQTYPNNQVFPAVANEVVPAHMNCFYNGNLEFKVDEVVYVPGISTDEMLCVRTTQQSSASTFSERFGIDGCPEIGADLTLNGSRKNVVTLTVPSFPGQKIQHVTATTRNYVVLYTPGFLIAGGGNLGRI